MAIHHPDPLRLDDSLVRRAARDLGAHWSVRAGRASLLGWEVHRAPDGPASSAVVQP